MNFQQLLTFSTVVSEGSMTAAAEKLYLTQPAVSQQIRNLEEELAVNLLERGSRHARPTVQGQLLFDYAKRIIALTQQAQTAIQTLGDKLSGDLKIGTLNSLGLQMLSPAASIFIRHNPQVSVKLTYHSGLELAKALEVGELDAAVLPDISSEYGVESSTLEAKPLMKDEMWFVTSGRDAPGVAELPITALLDRPIVQLTGEYPGFEKVFSEVMDKYRMESKASFASNNVGTIKRVIESGYGWGFLPAHSVRKQVRAGRLVHIDVPEVRHATPLIFYAARAERPKMQVVELFFNTLKQTVSSPL